MSLQLFFSSFFTKKSSGFYCFYFVPLVLTKSSVGVPQVTLINEAVSVLVHDSEGLKTNTEEL